MKYPMMNNQLIIRQAADSEDVLLTDFYSEEATRLDSELFDFLCALDGHTHPYSIRPELDHSTIDRTLDMFRDKHLVRESRFFKEGLTACCTVYIPKNRTNTMRPARIICFFLTLLLLVSWLPVLVLGIYKLIHGDFDSDHYLTGFIIGLIAGMVMHEISHAVSGCAFGARIFELGLALSYFVFPCAYVLMDPRPIKKKLRKAQTDAAGVEMNFLLCGLFFLLAAKGSPISGICFGAGWVNGALGLINLMIINRLDGGHILGDVLGTENFFGCAVSTIIGKDEKKYFKKRGINGYATIIASYIIVLSQIALLIMFLAGILEFILWFK